MPKQLIKLFILGLILFLFGCSGRLFTVYKIDIQQGNALEPDKVNELEIGMTKEQVKFLLGTPLVTDIFHPDRWDYIYYLIPGYGERERRHLTLFFENNNVSEIVKNQMEEPVKENPESKES